MVMTGNVYDTLLGRVPIVVIVEPDETATEAAVMKIAKDEIARAALEYGCERIERIDYVEGEPEDA